MTTNTDGQTLPRFDFTTTERVSFSRLVSVELQKTVDTRAGRWLVAAVLALTASIMILYYAIGEDTDKTFVNFIGFAAGPQSFLLPVLGVMLVTSEWSQRTALVTFALAPSRTQVIGAKVVAAALLALAAFAGASSSPHSPPWWRDAMTGSPTSPPRCSCSSWPFSCSASCREWRTD